MVLHPDVQERAQDEIDRIIGNERLPDFSDKDSLPYVEQVLQECRRFGGLDEFILQPLLTIMLRRWHPVVPLGEFTPESKSEV